MVLLDTYSFHVCRIMHTRLGTSNANASSEQIIMSEVGAETMQKPPHEWKWGSGSGVVGGFDARRGTQI
jgi:hypothetical protein